MRNLFLAAVLVSRLSFGVVQLDFWQSMTGVKGALLARLVDKFNALPENQGMYKVSMEFIGSYEEGLNKLRTALLARRGPHIVQITDIGAQVMVDSAAVEPLQKFIDEDPGFPLKEIVPQVKNYYTMNGIFYSLPFATSNPIIYYNVDRFEKAGLTRPPKTFDELKLWARKLTDPKQHFTGLTWPLHSWFMEEFIARQGGLLVDHENGRAGRAEKVFFTSPEALFFVNFWKEVNDEGTFANVGRGWEAAEQNFLAGRSAMFITSTSDVFEVGKNAPFRVMTAPIPVREGFSGGTIVGGNSLWIMKDKPDEEKKASYRFVKFMASKEAQVIWHTNTGYFPIRLDVIQSLEKEGFYKEHPAAKTAIDQMRSSPNIAATQGAMLGVFAEAREYVHNAIEQILSHRASVEDALGRAKRLTEEAIHRYNRSLSK